MEPRIQYAKTKDGVSIAYWTMGEGEPPLVMSPPLAWSHISRELVVPELASSYEHLSSARMLVRYDQRNQGLSDRNVEPKVSGETRLTSNTARTHLLLDSKPLPWTDWAAEFRERLPEEIKTLMDEVTAGSVSSDHRSAMRERLRQIRDLFRLSRYRLTPRGAALVDDTARAGGTARPEDDGDEGSIGTHGRRRSGGRAGNIYAIFLASEGTPAELMRTEPEPEIRWVTVADGTRELGFLEDRAGKYLPEQHLLQINGDFRVFTDMVDRWCRFYRDVPGAVDTIRDVVREWFEQALIETILGLQALQDSREWSIEDLAKAWSEESLTSAAMPRYHVDVAVRRALGTKLGSLKEKTA